ncbi:uroporphyrinogen-III C-methyltransferase [Nesterenkonia flava]|uniref:uroporphyrinogen-III C-methyltransferase n=1 Tax=Nesterenkonia flava TaxID=469799 RepID=A0ABU1FUV0_9MICC|nr:uroporphyrinogen-III C-methyltransferase [Nesterenkonia flava]MDR5712127.1 uroporphyrinogen-III C-methyltransferase [Nesterenkonia flava]
MSTEQPAGKRIISDDAFCAGATSPGIHPAVEGGRAMGEVALVGGGPGAADLMTVRARDVLAAADVVYYDRLAPTDELRAWAPQAALFDVGKRPGHHRITQENIHAMMIASARAGQRVVRFKGGDPFVFGRGCEEVAACREAGIPVTVVPGVTSAVAVPAAAGIPVTARGVTRAFSVISGHDPLSEEEFASLVGLGGTIVILMGVGTLGHTVEGLRRHGLPATTPVGIVENGYSRQQRVSVASLEDVLGVAASRRVSSPAVLVIGEVVRLAAPGPLAGEAVVDRYAAAKTRHAILEAAAAAGVGEGRAFPAADHAAAPQWTPDVRAGA